ncbi:hypothetical protein COOONC_00540 [Cooperia oncophora]
MAGQFYQFFGSAEPAQDNEIDRLCRIDMQLTFLFPYAQRCYIVRIVFVSCLGWGTCPSPPQDSESVSIGAPPPSPDSPETVHAGALTAPLDDLLAQVDDASVLHGRDAKALRNAASVAIAQVWRDARFQTTALAQRINEGNTSLTRKLNESFLAVGNRLDSLPTVAMMLIISLAIINVVISRPAASANCPAPMSATTVEEFDTSYINAHGTELQRTPPRRPLHHWFLLTVALLFNVLMACDAFLPPPSPSADPLASAQQRIAELSLKVDQTKAELSNSQSRVVLLQHNEELAQSAFDNKPSTSSNSSATGLLPDVRLLFLCCFALASVANCSASPDAWLCPTENPTNLFFVPYSYNCSWLLPNSTTQLQSLQVYRLNTKRYSTPASFCKIIRHFVSYSVNFFGARTETHVETHLPVSAEECKLMSRHKKFAHGDMFQHGDIWRSTNNAVAQFMETAPSRTVPPSGCLALRVEFRLSRRSASDINRPPYQPEALTSRLRADNVPLYSLALQCLPSRTRASRTFSVPARSRHRAHRCRARRVSFGGTRHLRPNQGCRRRDIRTVTKRTQVDIHTVDSVQGREKDVVVLLTTRTGFDAERGEFPNDPHRLHVALSRCLHGQFVLGHEKSLAGLSYWDILLRWARNSGAVTTTASLPDLLE